LIIAAGYLWRFFDPGGLDRHRVRHALNVTVLNFFLPALAFGLVAGARVDRSFFSIPATAAAVVVLCTAAVFAVYRLIPGLRDLPGPVFGVMVLAAVFGNVTYLGLPVIAEMLGPGEAYAAILYDQLASTPILLTAGVFLAARYGKGKPVSMAASLKRVALLPPLWGVVAGVAVRLSGLAVPQLVLDTAALMGKAVIPIMTFTVGLALDFGEVKRLGIAAPALAIKLLLAPILAWWVGSRLGLGGAPLKAVTIEGAMPVMVLSLAIADEFELDVPLAAACIAGSTVLLFITLPVVMKMLF
jgi:malate permease and related proteins